MDGRVCLRLIIYMSANPNKKQLREFGIIIGFGLPFIIGWLIPFLWGHPFREWTLIVGIFALLSGFIFPKILFYPYKLWMIIGELLGFINSKIILSVVFLFVVIPISFMLKIFNYQPLKIYKEKDCKSYKERRKTFMIDLRKIF